MPDCFRICPSPLHKFLGNFIQRLGAPVKIKNWKRRRPKRPVSDFGRSTSSTFAAMEVSNQLKQVFKFMDSNGDGKLSPSELSEVLSSLGQERSMAAKEAQGMVREMDSNGDGLVDLDEFMSVVMDTQQQEVGVACGGRVEDDLMEVFLVFDADKNGFISAEELQRVLVGLGCDNCSLEECRRMIRGVDKDGDGLVDFQEFKAMMLAMNSGFV